MSKIDAGNGGGRTSSMLHFIGSLFSRIHQNEVEPVVRVATRRAATREETFNLENSLNKCLILVLFLLGGYGVWLLNVSGGYQALCQLSYWRSTSLELQACDDIKSELTNYR